jgi:hypothetical protein
MTTNESPAPRANAASGASLKAEHNRSRASAGGAEAVGAGAHPDRARRHHDRLRTRGHIDFAAINRAALGAFPAVLARILQCVSACKIDPLRGVIGVQN